MEADRRRLLTFAFDKRRDAERRWLRIQRTAMACRFEVALEEDRADHLDAARQALDEAGRVEALLTIFRQSSELSRVNREAFGDGCSADPELVALLRRCGRLHDDTDGAFDITSTPLSRFWEFLRRDAQVPEQRVINEARRLVGMSHVKVSAESDRIQFLRDGVELNLGAIGKGYAIDSMGSVLRQRDVRCALVSAGTSSVLAIGGHLNGWPIDISSPQLPGRIARVHLRSGALGTSGPGMQFTMADGERYGHVIDPRSGWPARGVTSASVITSSAADADALSTAFLVGGPELAARYCASHPGTLALLTLDEGQRPTLVCGSYAGAVLED